MREWKNEGKPGFCFYISAWTGSGSNRPMPSVLSTFRSRFVLIRINPTPLKHQVWSGSVWDGYRPLSVGLGRFLVFFFNFIAICTVILANWTCCMPNFVKKIPRFLLYVFYYFLDVLWYFTCENWIKICVFAFCDDLCPFRRFLDVSCATLAPILYGMFLMIDIRFARCFAHDLW